MTSCTLEHMQSTLKDVLLLHLYSFQDYCKSKWLQVPIQIALPFLFLKRHHVQAQFKGSLYVTIHTSQCLPLSALSQPILHQPGQTLLCVPLLLEGRTILARSRAFTLAASGWWSLRQHSREDVKVTPFWLAFSTVMTFLFAVIVAPFLQCCYICFYLFYWFCLYCCVLPWTQERQLIKDFNKQVYLFITSLTRSVNEIWDGGGGSNTLSWGGATSPLPYHSLTHPGSGAALLFTMQLWYTRFLPSHLPPQVIRL